MSVDTWGESTRNQKKKANKVLKGYSKAKVESFTEYEIKHIVILCIKYSLIIFGVSAFIYIVAKMMILILIDYKEVLSEFGLPSWLNVWIWLPLIWGILWFVSRGMKRGRYL